MKKDNDYKEIPGVWIKEMIWRFEGDNLGQKEMKLNDFWNKHWSRISRSLPSMK